MKTMPLTFEGWIELCILVSLSYAALIFLARAYSTKIIVTAFIYICSVTLLYSTPYSMVITLIPYITVLLVCILITHLFTAKIESKKQQLPASIKPEPSPWLSACLKTIFNHPVKHTSVTLCIDHAQALTYNGDHTELSLAWNQELFTSILYDPHTAHRIFSFTQEGVLKTFAMQKPIQEDKTNVHQTLLSYMQQSAPYPLILCTVNQEARTCTLLHNGTILAPKNIAETVQYITTVLHQTHATQEGVYHGARHEKQNTHNHTP